MDIEDFYKIFADMEDAQEARFKQFKADIMETIAANKAEQKKDLVTLSNNTITISRQLDNLGTSKNATDSPEIRQELRNTRLDMIELTNHVNSSQIRFWWLLGFTLVLFGVIEYQIYNLPEQTADEFIQRYAQQTKPSKSHQK